MEDLTYRIQCKHPITTILIRNYVYLSELKYKPFASMR